MVIVLFLSYHSLSEFSLCFILVVLINICTVLLVLLVPQLSIHIDTTISILWFCVSFHWVGEFKGSFHSDLIRAHPSFGVIVPLKWLEVWITLEDYIRVAKWWVTVVELSTCDDFENFAFPEQLVFWCSNFLWFFSIFRSTFYWFFLALYVLKFAKCLYLLFKKLKLLKTLL